MKTIKNQIAEIKRISQEFKSALKTKVSALPDNSKIQRMSNSPSCFTMSFSDLAGGKTMSPSYYDFKLQYEAICDIIDNTDLINLPAKLEKIILNQRIDTGKYSVTHKLSLHPEVVKLLKETLMEEIL